MNEIDKKIRDALQKEDAWLYDKLSSEQSMQEMIFDSFKGRQKWLIVLVWFWTFAFFVAGIYSFIVLWGSSDTDVRQMMIALGAFLFFMQGVLGLKTWYWMQLQQNTMAREIKRLELEVSVVAKLLDDRSP